MFFYARQTNTLIMIAFRRRPLNYYVPANLCSLKMLTLLRCLSISLMLPLELEANLDGEQRENVNRKMIKPASALRLQKARLT